MKKALLLVGLLMVFGTALVGVAAEPGTETESVLAPEREDLQLATTCWKLIVGNGRPSGAGTVAKSPGPNCNFDYLDGTIVTLTANPNPGFSFVSWNGACAGQGNPCVLTMDAHKTTSPNWQ